MNILLVIPAVNIGLPIIGAIYQAIATTRDKRNFLPPGQLIDVGGHRLHLHVTGTVTRRDECDSGDGLIAWADLSRD
jgi:hypothetical protein